MRREEKTNESTKQTFEQSYAKQIIPDLCRSNLAVVRVAPCRSRGAGGSEGTSRHCPRVFRTDLGIVEPLRVSAVVCRIEIWHLGALESAVPGRHGSSHEVTVYCAVNQHAHPQNLKEL